QLEPCPLKMGARKIGQLKVALVKADVLKMATSKVRTSQVSLLKIDRRRFVPQPPSPSDNTQDGLPIDRVRLRNRLVPHTRTLPLGSFSFTKGEVLPHEGCKNLHDRP